MQSNLKCDVVVVGAGPAGSTAARFLAKNGIDVIVVDKRQEIGAPKRCAEGIRSKALERVGLTPNPMWAVNKIRGAILYSPSGKQLKTVIDDAGGYILERKIFEKHLAAEAIRAGARYMIKTIATGVMKENGYVSGIRAEYMGDEFEIKSGLVIAADGVDSRIAKSAGLDTVNKLTDYHSGFQYEMANLNLIDSNMLHIYFGENVAPRGYVWIFPKGKDTANVGIGILGLKSDDGNRAKDYLDRFIKNHPKIFENSSPIEINSGGIPVSSSIDTFVANGLMIVGDAAQQVNPIHGGGIALAMDAARIVADVGSKAIKENNLSKERLYEYEKIWRETNGKRMKKLLKLRNFLEKLEDNDFEKFTDILNGEDVVKLTEGKYRYLLKLFMRKAPKMLPLAKKFLFTKDD